MENISMNLILLALIPVFIFALVKALGIVIIGEMQVGIVTKKMSRKTLPPGRVVALNGEAGLQADTLAPGWHFGYWPFVFDVKKVPVVQINPGQLGLVMALDGVQIPPNRILAKQVSSDNFQDASAFLKNGGQKGKQISMLTAGVYRINTALFKLDMVPVTVINSDTVGIVTTFDGAPLENGEIAGSSFPGHGNFQDIQAFVDNGGKRGLQEQVILAGQWNLNPWFASVLAEKMTNIPISNVGVVTSFVGKEHKDISGENFKHGDLVEQGHKGVWATPIYPGMHPVNTSTMKIAIVPTNNVVLNWATNRTESHALDANLSSITVRSKDGFSYNLDVSVVIHVGAKEAARVISRMGSMAGLISQVLEPTIGNYFRNSAQEYAALDFLKSRTEMQQKAAQHVKNALKEYDVEAVDTLIGDIVLPKELLETQTQRKLAEEMQKTYETQQQAQKQKETLNRQIAITEMQKEVVANEQGVRIAELKAEGVVKAAKGETLVAEQQAEQIRRRTFAENCALQQRMEAEASGLKSKTLAEAEGLKAKGLAEAAGIEAKGKAQAESYKLAVDAMGQRNFTLLETMSSLGREKVKMIPDIIVGGSGENQGGQLMNLLMTQIIKDKVEGEK